MYLDLLRAYKARELTNLDRAIAVATAANEDRSFDPQLLMARLASHRLTGPTVPSKRHILPCASLLNRPS
jgi:hypothetical protein